MGSIIDVKGPLGKFARYVAAAILFLTGIISGGYFPYRDERYLFFSIPVGILGFLSMVQWIRNPNSRMNDLLSISGSSLIALLAYRSMNYVFPQLSVFVEVLMLLSFLVVHTLRFWSMSTAIMISDELYAPKTIIGKIVFRILLITAPLAPVASSLLGGAAVNRNKTSILVVGLICLYLAYSIPFLGLSSYSKNSAKPQKKHGPGRPDSNLTKEKTSHNQSETRFKNKKNN